MHNRAGGWTPYPLWTPSDGWAGQEVVGTHAYLNNVRQMFGRGFDPAGSELNRTVQLIPEPENPHDRNAVSVRCESGTIGYLPREDAARFQAPLLELMSQGYIPTVNTRVWAREYDDWDDHGRKIRTLHVNANLYIADPDTMIPCNDPPAQPYTLLPQGGSVQVAKTADHFDVLGHYRPPNGVGSLIVTMEPIEQRTARTTKRLAEIRLDGAHIGQLTPAMSEKFLPAVDHLLARGLTPAMFAVLNASPVSATVSLRAQKAFELSPEVLNGPPVTIPARGVPRPAHAIGGATTNPDDAPAVEVQTATTAMGSRITVTESPADRVVTVSIEFAQPLTAWQSRTATDVLATGQRLLTSSGLPTQAPQLTATSLTSTAPLDQAQPFVDALLGIDDSDFGAAQEFNTR
ncbi:HIRAN domain-containing protein [Nocardia sp. IFM 10818]